MTCQHFGDRLSDMMQLRMRRLSMKRCFPKACGGEYQCSSNRRRVTSRVGATGSDCHVLNKWRSSRLRVRPSRRCRSAQHISLPGPDGGSARRDSWVSKDSDRHIFLLSALPSRVKDGDSVFRVVKYQFPRSPSKPQGVSDEPKTSKVKVKGVIRWSKTVHSLHSGGPVSSPDSGLSRPTSSASFVLNRADFWDAWTGGLGWTRHL